MPRTVADTPVARQWSARNPLPADRVPASSSELGWWRCDAEHEWSARISNRTYRQTGCPFCSGRRRIAGVNDFASLHPGLLALWHPDNPRDPRTLGPRSNTRARWICADGHQWEAPVSTLTAGHGCPYCTRTRATVGVNDLATTHPALAAEWDDAELAPTAVTAGSSRKVWWACAQCRHRWRSKVVGRANTGHGCPECGKRRAAARRSLPRPGRSLAETPAPCRPPSPGEVDLRDTVAALVPGLEVRANDRRTVRGHELDVYLPALGVAIEYNGVYYHSEQFRDRAAHAAKHTAARMGGVRLITVWEDDWLARRDIVIRMIAARLGVTGSLPSTHPGVDRRASERLGARALILGEIDGKASAAFLDRNHLQGPVTCSRRFVLTDDGGRIRALLALRSPRGGARAGRRHGEWRSCGSRPAASFPAPSHGCSPTRSGHWQVRSPVGSRSQTP